MYYVTLIDDHELIRQGLSSLISSFSNFRVLFEAGSGRDFIAKLKPSALPHLVLMDVTMPDMDGYETCNWLRVNYPSVKVIALSVMDDEESIIRMLKSGAKGYLLKNTNPAELQTAMESVMERGYHFNDLVSNKVIKNINDSGKPGKEKNEVHLTDREVAFLKLACTEMSYKEIGLEMNVSSRTVETFRDNLFAKLELKTRVGLVLYAIKRKIVEF
ncbi:response regulator transcription factor [Daejeonella lutea]|uniref:DNA-binding response regulator, NarL/FixJ family, contains REC and HTH domains n=1 Tax=Daejeonella lutea TaxID=572036 RepID=A0A1T5DNJ5_9SPHI|nr:response regulator transcription factor [Daejeonella lutea]SKB73170.1 DNA-binding response regulator, NarL/FixJ family, contains REC and HTH domains [Daejeonella lutea]